MQKDVQQIKKLVKYLAAKYEIDIIAFKREGNVSKVWSTSNVEYDVSSDERVLEYMHKTSFRSIVCIVDNEVAEEIMRTGDSLLIFNLDIT